ncbi:MAG TPA: hypothetical protein DCX07_08330 [Phycisphaerales bacterium]|nr:hypothetical protein [Phycisphaerales bacterium]
MSQVAPDASGNGPRDCGLFFLDVIGQYAPDRISVRWCDTPRATNDKLEALIEQTWTGEMERARQTERRLFDGRLCRLVHCEASEQRLELTVGAVSYREFLGTNLRQAHVRYLYGGDVLANPLGVSAALATNDGFLIFGRRSERVSHHAGRIHPLGGMVEPPASSRETPDPLSDMLNELREETNLPDSCVRECVCLGLVRDKHIVQPELVFDIAVDADAATIRQSFGEAVDAGEHSELLAVRSHPSVVVNFIEQRFGELTPVALATMLLYGLRHWGSGWFAAARGYLRSVI